MLTYSTNWYNSTLDDMLYGRFDPNADPLQRNKIVCWMYRSNPLKLSSLSFEIE